LSVTTCPRSARICIAVVALSRRSTFWDDTVFGTFVKPERGMLVLFPSYFWHGTVPFGGSDTRLTVAFDAVPA